VTGRRYVYAEAREFSRRFAASLRRAGLQPGNTVLIVMPNTAEWPIIMLGATEAGLNVSTANPTYTPGECSPTCLHARGDNSDCLIGARNLLSERLVPRQLKVKGFTSTPWCSV